MNVIKETRDNQTALLKVTIGEADYNEAVNKALASYRKKANIPGFRPGMVPMQIINKMYRKGVVAEESYRLASNGAFDYIKANDIQIIGDMMPADEQQPLDFDNAFDYEFVFEIGLAPEVNIALGKKDKASRYTIEITDTMREGYASNHKRRFGKLEEVPVVEKDEALTVKLHNDDLTVDEAYVGLIGMSDDERKPFIGKKVGGKMKVDVAKLYKTPSQRAAALGVKEEELANINPKFDLEVTKIRKFVEPALDEEFFKMVFPAGDVTNEKEFNAKIDAQIATDLARETEFKFAEDIKALATAKAALTLPEQFLYRWLCAINEGKFSQEEIDRDFPKFVEMMKWDLIKRFYIAKYDIKVDREEAVTEAKALALMQFAYYGMPSVADDMLANYAESMLNNKEEAQKIYEKLYDTKIINNIASEISVKDTPIKSEEFSKLFEQQA